jgi:DNA recombination protein RmuC
LRRIESMENGLLVLLLVLVAALLAVAVLILYLQLGRSRQEARTAESLLRLEPVTEAVGRIQLRLTELQAHAQARQDLERRTAESIKRLETVIAGTSSKGAAGENILEAMFANLPPEWQVRDFRVGNRTVEFGLVLPNRLILPIDSKWPATDLLERFLACQDPMEQQDLKARIEATVLSRVREIRKYIDPNLTVGFAVAVVPDAVYDLCYRVHPQVFRLNVVLVSYSMFVPYLLLVFQTILRTSQSIDLQRMEAYLEDVWGSIRAMQDELEGRFSRAMTMLTNSRNDMRTHLGRVSGGLTSLQVSTGRPTPAGLPENTAPAQAAQD